MSDAISSFGTFLKKGDGGTPETFTTIAEVRDIDGPETTLEFEDATSHDSTDGWEEVLGTILKGEPVSFELNFIPTDPTHDATTGLQADQRNRTLRNFQLVYPDPGGSGFEFAALVTKISPKAPVKGILRADVQLKPSGVVTPI